MIPVKHYHIEVDVDSFYKTDGGLYLDRIGEQHDLVPKHGKILKTPIAAKFREGDLAYFMHFEAKRIYKKDGKNYIDLPESSIIAIQRGDEWLRGVMIPADKIPAKKKTDSLIITDLSQKEEYETHKFIVDGEVVWTYTNSPYQFDYIDKVFLRPNFIVYNESKGVSMDNFVILEVLDEGEEYSAVNGIYRTKREVTQRGRARVARPNKYGLEGEVVFLKSTNNKLSFDNLAAVRFQYILGCYEKS